MPNKNSSAPKEAKPKRKSILQQVMKPKDWLMLSILIVFSIACWSWVLWVYSQPFDYNLIMSRTLGQ